MAGTGGTRQRTERTLFDGQIVKRPGGEWHSNPIPLNPGEDLGLDARGNTRFYAGIFDEANYQRLRQMARPAFPFRFGTDQVAFNISRRAPVPGQYRIVLRVGAFVRQAATIQVRVTVTT
jgi:hypothetical protein